MPTNKSRTIKYTATFPNGEVVTRKSERTYTHAWLVNYAMTQAGIERVLKTSPWREQYIRKGETLQVKGFSNGRFLAEKALRTASPDPAYYEVKFQGIVEVTHG